MSAAQQRVEGGEPTELIAEPFALKQQVAERLAQHRARRRRGDEAGGNARTETTHADAVGLGRPGTGRSAEIAAAVAKRYAESPSYRAVLASESARSVCEAEAAAEVANINARAIARAQQHLLAELGDWGSEAPPVHTVPIGGPLPVAEPARAAAAILQAQQAQRAQKEQWALEERSLQEQEQRLQQGLVRDASRGPASPDRLAEEAMGRAPAPARAEAVVTEVSRAGLTVRLIEEVTRPAYHAGRSPAQPVDDDRETMEQESMLLDEEILFRNDPTFDETRGPEPLAANLIEFPRQLVAARKARPRLAEGPLWGDGAEADAGQLRIFEVEAEHIAVAPAIESQAAEWSSILLSAQPATTFFEPVDGDYAPLLVPQAAAVSRRMMAGVMDGALITIGTLAGVAVFVLTVRFLTHEPLAVPRLVAAGVVAAALAVSWAIYHLLFFSFADGTPGMRYARIALCTMADQNPTRAAMRRRLLAMALSATPLGMGYVWALLDGDRLGWHDRISRMYQRAY